MNLLLAENITRLENVFKKQFQDRPLPDRWKRLAYFLIIIIAIGYFFMIRPVSHIITSRETEQQAIKTKLTKTELEINRYKALARLPVSPQMTTEITALEIEWAAIQRIPIVKSTIVTSDNQQKMLDDLTKTNSRLQLVNIDHKDANIVLSLHGNFAGLVDYLYYLDALSWAFTYESLNYQATNYPTADIILTLQTQKQAVTFYQTPPVLLVDPTKPFVVPVQATPVSIALTGVFHHGNRWSAMINGKIYVVGDKVGPNEIRAITDTGVLLLTPNGEVRVSLVPSIRIEVGPKQGK